MPERGQSTHTAQLSHQANLASTMNLAVAQSHLLLATVSLYRARHSFLAAPATSPRSIRPVTPAVDLVGSGPRLPGGSQERSLRGFFWWRTKPADRVARFVQTKQPHKNEGTSSQRAQPATSAQSDSSKSRYATLLRFCCNSQKWCIEVKFKANWRVPPRAACILVGSARRHVQLRHSAHV